MSDAEDVAAIQVFLKNTSTQVSAHVASTSLPQAKKDEWYALAKSILAYVSQAASAKLAPGRELRTRLNAFVKSLEATAPGLSRLIASAPAPVPAPPPKGTPNPLLESPILSMLEGPQLPWLILLALYLWGRR